MNIIKILSHSFYGSDPELLIKLHRVMVLPIIQYGSIAFCTANDVSLRLLDPINNQGIRLSLGAFRTSPVESLLAEANQKPLSLLRMESHIRYMLKTLSIKNNVQSRNV